jgi:hypothetical protein
LAERAFVRADKRSIGQPRRSLALLATFLHFEHDSWTLLIIDLAED